MTEQKKRNKALHVIKTIAKVCAYIFTGLLYALTVYSAYGGRFNTDIYTFPAVMVLVFPWLATCTIVVSVLWFCFRKIYAGAIGLVVIIACWSPMSTVMPTGWSRNATPGAQTFTIMTFNMIHGWDQEQAPSSPNRTVEYILDTDADIVCLQEVLNFEPGGDIPNLTEEQYNRVKEKYPYILGDNRLDMKVLSKYPATFEPGYNYIEGDYDLKRYSFYKININGHPLTLINVHLMSFLLSPKERDVVTDIHSIESVRNSYHELTSNIREKLSRGFKKRKYDTHILRKTVDHISGPLIICGDFNDVPESYAYRLLKGEDLKDAYVETGFGPMVTFNQHLFWFHLDQILYKGDLRALSVEKGYTKISDHYPLIATFEFQYL